MAPPVTIRDVAQRAGVSTATVSYVLNESRPVGEETRKRVQNAVEELGYRPSIIARGLQAGQSRIIGYSWRPAPPNQFNPVLEKFIHSVAEATARYGYHVLTFPYPEPYDELEVYREMAESGRVDGFVLPNTRFDDQRIRYLLDEDFPFVAFGRSNPEWEFPWVDVDGAGGVRMAVDHLLRLGHRRIALLGWMGRDPVGTERTAGYHTGMDAAGIDVDPDWVKRVENDYFDAYRAAQSWLSLPASRTPTAVVAFSDLIAIGVMNAAADAGRRVGRDLAVVGFDDAPVACYLRPPLTSLRQPMREVGDCVVKMLIDQLCGKELVPDHILLEPKLVVRESTSRWALSEASRVAPNLEREA
jgi:DNA-binding LacI/PurR family transcriptional regulator